MRRQGKSAPNFMNDVRMMSPGSAQLGFRPQTHSPVEEYKVLCTSIVVLNFYDMADTTRLVIVRLLIGAIFYGMFWFYCCDIYITAHTGIHVIAFCICVYYTCYHKSNRRSHHWMQFVLWSMFALGTMNFISSTLFTYSALSCTHLTKGDPAKWMNDNHTDVMNTLDNASATLMFLLQDWVMVCRTLHMIYL